MLLIFQKCYGIFVDKICGMIYNVITVFKQDYYYVKGENMNNDTEKEIIYEFDAVTPKSAYTKILYGRISSKFRIPLIVFQVISDAEIIVMFLLSRTYLKYFWILMAIFLLFTYYVRFSAFRVRQKNYKKIHEANEDCYTYTFYDDSVKIKNTSVESVLKYSDAEYHAEDKKRIIIVFPFNRSISLEKELYSDEQLDFFRSIVPEQKQKKFEKKTLIRFIIKTLVNIVISVVLAVSIFRLVKLNAEIKAESYHSQYTNTTFESFEGCMNYGLIRDVVIIKDKYIEYTYIGNDEETRYSTKCPDGKLDDLKEKMDKLDVEWKNKEG